jgi:hypothetical protein
VLSKNFAVAILGAFELKIDAIASFMFASYHSLRQLNKRSMRRCVLMSFSDRGDRSLSKVWIHYRAW